MAPLSRVGTRNCTPRPDNKVTDQPSAQSAPAQAATLDAVAPFGTVEGESSLGFDGQSFDSFEDTSVTEALLEYEEGKQVSKADVRA